MARVALVHREFEWPKAWSHGPSLMYDSSIVLKLLSTKSRQLFPLPSEAWKCIFHCLMIMLLSLFLQKSYEILQGEIGVGLNDLVSLSTSLWNLHLRRLGHSQNSMELLWLLLKKSRNLLRMAAECNWSGYAELSKMCFAEWMESVIITILEMLALLHAWLMPHLIAKSLALELVTKTAWWTVLVSGKLAWYIYTIKVAMLFLMLALVTTIVEEGEEFKRTKMSSSWAQVMIFSFLSTKLNKKQLGKMSDICCPGVNS